MLAFERFDIILLMSVENIVSSLELVNGISRILWHVGRISPSGSCSLMALTRKEKDYEEGWRMSYRRQARD